MGSKVEKVCRGGVAGFRPGKPSRYAQALKRAVRRARRRAGRRDPANAGRRVRDFTRGWSD